MKRVFVFQDFKSQKFWSIEVVGTDVTVNYGKLGTAGQTQVKNYATTEEAEKAANKLIAEKTKKGYVETAEETAREMKVEAKKYTLSYDEYENDVKLLDKILKDKHLSEYKQITIGCWDYEGDDCSALLQGLIENKDKFAQIEGLFWGDIEQEEQEISWIEQADLSPLLDSMPKLKDLKIKGTNNLRLGRTSRPELRSLEIISGGMPTEVVEDILASDFPNLEKLILYVAGLRMGFGFMSKELEKFSRYSNKYLGYNRISEDIAIAALKSDAHYRNIAKLMNEDRERYEKEIGVLPGFKVYESVANFILIKYPIELKEALQKAFAEQSYKVKFMNEPDINTHLRITLGRPEQNRIVIDTIKEIASK